MNIALAPSEIAQFLDKRTAAIHVLWAKQELNRSLFTENRTTLELANSSIFDVLEHYIRTDVINPHEGNSAVEAWMAAIEEMIESVDWASPEFEALVFKLMELYLDFSGAPVEAHDIARRASSVMLAYFVLIGFVQAELRAQDPAAHLSLV